MIKLKNKNMRPDNRLIRIDKDSLAQADYMQRLLRIKKSNLLASPLYANIEAQTQNAKIQYKSIWRDGFEAGITLWLEKTSILGLRRSIICHRMPLWFDGFGDTLDQQLFWREFRITYLQSIFTKLSIIPESSDPEYMKAFKQHTLIDPYETYWLDISQNEDTLLHSMRKSWKQDIKQAERVFNKDISLYKTRSINDLKMIIQLSDHHRRVKSYNAPSRQYLERLCLEFLDQNQCEIWLAKYGHEILSAIIILKHGQSATYQIGYSSVKGRSMKLTKLLLWNAILDLKSQGVSTLDLGGVNKHTPQLTMFKSGLGGDYVRLSGFYS
jgi:hypothetical protein